MPPFAIESAASAAIARQLLVPIINATDISSAISAAGDDPDWPTHTTYTPSAYSTASATIGVSAVHTPNIYSYGPPHVVFSLQPSSTSNLTNSIIPQWPAHTLCIEDVATSKSNNPYWPLRTAVSEDLAALTKLAREVKPTSALTNSFASPTYSNFDVPDSHKSPMTPSTTNYNTASATTQPKLTPSHDMITTVMTPPPYVVITQSTSTQIYAFPTTVTPGPITTVVPRPHQSPAPTGYQHGAKGYPSDGLDGGMVLWIVIGSVFGLCILCACCGAFCRGQRRTSPLQEQSAAQREAACIVAADIQNSDGSTSTLQRPIELVPFPKPTIMRLGGRDYGTGVSAAATNISMTNSNSHNTMSTNNNSSDTMPAPPPYSTVPSLPPVPTPPTTQEHFTAAWTSQHHPRNHG